MKIDDRGAVGLEIGWAGGRDCHDVAPGRLRGQDAGVSVLKDQTVAGACAHLINRQQIALRVRLTFRNVFRGNENPG